MDCIGDLYLLGVPIKGHVFAFKSGHHLNRELLKKEPALIDYVIIHELCHLVHHNHSKKYYALLERLLPDYRELRRRLRSM